MFRTLATSLALLATAPSFALQGHLKPITEQLNAAWYNVSDINKLQATLQEKFYDILDAKNENEYKKLIKEIDKSLLAIHKSLLNADELDMQNALGGLINTLVEQKSTLLSHARDFMLHSLHRDILHGSPNEGLAAIEELEALGIDIRPYIYSHLESQNNEQPGVSEKTIRKYLALSNSIHVRNYSHSTQLIALELFLKYPNLQNLELLNGVGIPSAELLYNLNPETPPQQPHPLEHPRIKEMLRLILNEEQYSTLVNGALEFRSLKGSVTPTDPKAIAFRKQGIEKIRTELHTELRQKIERLNTDITVPDLIKWKFIDEEGPYIPYQNLKLRAGDVFIQRLWGTNHLFESVTESNLRFSHFNFIHFRKNGHPYLTSMMEQLTSVPFEAATISHNMFGIALRNKSLNMNQRKTVNKALSQLIAKKPGYDFRFDATNSKKLYCSELGQYIFERHLGLPKLARYKARNKQVGKWLKGMGLPKKGYITQASYLYNSQFELLGGIYNNHLHEIIAEQQAVSSFIRRLSHAKSFHPERTKEGFQSSLLAAALKFVPKSGFKDSSPVLIANLAVVLAHIDTSTQLASTEMQALGLFPGGRHYELYKRSLQERTEFHIEEHFQGAFQREWSIW